MQTAPHLIVQSNSQHTSAHHHSNRLPSTMSAALSLNLQSADCIMHKTEGVERKTKIFCTLGPACWSEEGLLELI
ncbi:hypothetical protein BBJ28_00026616, partial [Nothophytophthora sp. Chile5]